MNRTARRWVLLLAGLALGAGASADGGDHDRARRALEAGEILPLARILERVEREYPGRVMEVELEREGGQWRYEVKLIQRGGRVVKLELDARDATVLSAKGGGREDVRRDGRSR